MFESLRSAFSNVAKSLGEKELAEKDIDGALVELEMSLLESDVAVEVIDAVKADLKGRLVGASIGRKQVSEFVSASLSGLVSSMFDEAGEVDLLGLVAAKKESGAADPYVVVFVGINGTGKTTSLAKIAHMLQRAKFSVAIAAADTFRAGAIEQLREHANRLNLKLIAQKYGADPAAVARDAVLYARSHKVDCVLVDTAGRMQTSSNLMAQIGKITSVVKPDLRIFVGDSLAGNDTVSQAREFYEHVKFNGSILTKSDADARGGAALSVVKITSTPVMYLGVGQEYGDLAPFSKEAFLETVFDEGGPIGGEMGDKVSEVLAKTPASAPAEPAPAAPEPEPASAQAEPAQAEPAQAEPAQAEPAQAEPAQAEPAQAEPAPAAPEPEPAPAEPAPTAPEPEPASAPAEPAPAAPEPEPAPAEPAPTAPEPEPAPAEPAPTAPEPDPASAPAEPAPAEPAPAEPAPAEPAPAAPEPEPAPAEPAPAEPAPAPAAPEPETAPAAPARKDPFEGIATDDINQYADIHNASHPENDDQAMRMAAQIKRWVEQGRPDPKHLREPAEPEPAEPEPAEPEPAEAKKKKRSFFGRFRK